MWLDVCIVSVYVMVLVGIGLRGGRRVRTASDFTAADGNYGTAILFASLSSSYIGGGYSAGNAEKAFEGGIGMTLALCGFGLSMILTGKWLVPGVRRFRGQTTAGGVIGAAYGESARTVTGICAFLCCGGVVAAQMEGMGQVFHALLGVSPTQGVLLGSAIVLVYSTFGGLQSVISADVIQFLLLLVGLPLLLWLGLREAGGVTEVLESVPPSFLNPLNGRSVGGFIALFFSMMFGEALAPPYTQRLLVGKDAGSTARATVLSGIFSIPVFAVTGMVGLTAYALQVTEEASLAMPALILRVLPVGVRGIVMASMLSVMLSAADGFLNSAAISLVCDTLTPLYPDLRERTRLRLLRGVNVGVGLLAVAAALYMEDILDILMVAYGFWCPLCLPPLAAAFLGIRADTRIFLIALGAGLCATVLWAVAGTPAGIDGALVGMCANTAALAGGVLYTRRRRAGGIKPVRR